jgi:hypothetical protein
LSETREKVSFISTSDKIAITVASIAGCVAVIIYLVSAKTVMSTCIMLAFLFLFFCYPVIHFGRSWKVEIPYVVIICVLIVFVGKKEWPIGLSVSDLRVVKENVVPFIAGQSPQLNIVIMNDSPYAMRVRRITGIAIRDGDLRNMEALKEVESHVWDGTRQRFELFQEKAAPESYSMDLPPKVESILTLNSDDYFDSGGGGANRLTQAQADALQRADGTTTVFFMSIFAYSDGSGFHETEYCVLTQGKTILRCFRGHNGPVRPNKSYWWNW